jgi:hypothetical protein
MNGAPEATLEYEIIAVYPDEQPRKKEFVIGGEKLIQILLIIFHTGKGNITLDEVAKIHQGWGEGSGSMSMELPVINYIFF